MSRTFCQWAVALTCSLVVAGCSSNNGATDSVTYLKASEQKNAVVYREKDSASSQWLSNKEALLSESIKGSPFTLRKKGGALIVTAPAEKAFNVDRPDLLLPAMLGPITRIAKLLEANPDSAVLILGHTDVSLNDKANHKISTGRARAVASIFRLSGLKSDRMTHFGLGGSHQLSKPSHAQNNHRVEIIITTHENIQNVLAVYRPAYVRQIALSQAQ